MGTALDIHAKQARLSPEIAEQWAALSSAVVDSRLSGHAMHCNPDLEKTAGQVNGHPLALAYRYWAIENMMLAGFALQAAKLFDALALDAQKTQESWVPIQAPVAVLRRKADALRMLHDGKGAVTALTQALSVAEGSDANLALETARIAEELGDSQLAETLYGRIVTDVPAPQGDQARYASTVDDTLFAVRDQARRNLERLREQPEVLPNVESLARALANALLSRDARTLERLASRTHFRIGLGVHAVYCDTDVALERLLKVLKDLRSGGLTMQGGGGQRKLTAGRVQRRSPLRFAGFILRRNARGWQWDGISVLDARYWLPDLPAVTPARNQPLAIPILAPWQTGRKFMAGGFYNPWHGYSAGTVLDPLTMLIRSCSSACGFGIRGFYYNEPFSHNGVDGFAIDFTSYERCVALANRAPGYPVLAPADGIVMGKRENTPTGQDPANLVEVAHGVSEINTLACRYLSRYLHLEGGLGRVPVSRGMYVPRGTILGFMDNTGNSQTPHLHFSIHDMDRGSYPGVAASVSGIRRGPSVRPNPMGSERLDDADEARCVESTNVAR